MPSTAEQWGVTAIAASFAFLVAGVMHSLRRKAE
jgi:hypothetical protein